jgi:hypothetical protein
MRSLQATLLAGLALLVSSWCYQPQPKADKDDALNELQNQVNEMLPAILSLTGIQEREPVKTALLTRTELGRFFETNLKVEYPNEELKKRGRCFALIGLLPQGYDLENGFMTLLKEQAGAVYDPRSKTLIGLSDLPTEQRRNVNDRMILSHELTHALQDRVIDIVEESETALKNIDYEYALRAVLEGMASSVMIAHAQNLHYSELPNLQTFWRSQLSQGGGTLGGSPPYATEYLMSPYAEGGAFIQAWQKGNPDETMNDLLKRIPASSEQVLHFEKYAGGDKPTDFDLSRMHKTLPGHWKLFYANTLGEFELLELFRIHKETEANAPALAAGWDGCKFEAYEEKNGDLILLGSSVWDSEEDAEEFRDGFIKVLAESRPNGDYEVVRTKARVSFLIGPADESLRTAILESECRGDTEEQE